MERIQHLLDALRISGYEIEIQGEYNLYIKNEKETKMIMVYDTFAMFMDRDMLKHTPLEDLEQFLIDLL